MSRLMSRPARSGVLSACAVAALALATAACASDGRELAEGRPWQTTTTRPLPPTSAPPESAGTSGLTLSSPAFGPGDFAPVDATCAGANQPPTLEWSDAGPDTAEWAVSLSDQTDPANPLLLWLVVGIDPATTSLDPDRAPAPIETLNDYGQLGYGNPCIDTLSTGVRDLQFRVYSLTAPTGIASGAAGNESWDRVAAGANDSATLLMKVDANT
ncbi:MAG: hypothetical protein R2733_14600 [Acidimicrobiales bacterium]